MLKFLTSPKAGYDRTIIFVSLFLMLISIVLISSASVQEAANTTGDCYFYVKRQVAFISLSIVLGIVMASVPSQTWLTASSFLLVVSFILLALVLLVGHEVNNAKRWLALGPINLQPAEILKVVWILYFASYTSRRIDAIRTTIWAFFKPILAVLVIALFLLCQPDFGSLVVVCAITFGLLFVAGAGLLRYIVLLLCMGFAGVLLVVFEPYRFARVLSFLDPWQDRFDTGYQLVQSLIAFGNGGLTGTGIGNSIQKLGYLPEAHTDFVTSILGEEMGFFGVCFVILLEFILVAKAVILAISILRQKPLFQGYVAFGIGLFFCLQTTINIGAASGALPTKGLTLPLVSYGGSSLLVCAWALGVLLRIDFEWRQRQLGDWKYV